MRILTVPVKALAHGKSRLAPALAPLERAALSLAMLEDVLDPAQAQPGWDVWVVSPDDAVLEIAARLDGLRIVSRQAVEEFGLNRSPHRVVRGHSTASSTPWQLKPAPNDDIHQYPPGACSASAACSTKYTHGLLTLP